MFRVAHFLPILAASACVASAQPDPKPFEFTRMIAHWDQYGHPDYLPFVREAAPEVAQVGFYGAHFWSLVHTPQFGGYPAHFPVRGLKECSEWFRTLNRKLHEEDVRVVGHFNIEFLIGDPDGPEGPRGFFKWYRDHWDEELLGPRPVDDPLEFLERNADGSPITNRNYAIGGMNEYWACLRNPSWQKVLKAWVREGIRLGVDGFMINYFYRHECHCEHCEDAFRNYLRDRFSAAQLEERFGISDLAEHPFDKIVSWHPPEETSPLKLEMLRFSQVSNKDVFDEVFVRYGRSLKADLLAAQWNHLGNFSTISGDERCVLPGELWGKDESYLWYSTGGAANFSDLENRLTGDAILQARYIRGAFQDKPFTLGKYESTRIRTAIAELAANGGAPMGFYTRFTDPEARSAIIRYYRFLKKHDALFRGNRAYSEAVLAYPRSEVHRGNVAAVDRFRTLGRQLLDDHVLFEVLPDDLLTTDGQAPDQAVLRTTSAASDAPSQRSRFKAPFTVRVSASRPRDSHREIDLHLVNYHRREPAKDSRGKPSPGAGIKDENPIATPQIEVDFRLPTGEKASAVQFLTPESETATPLAWTAKDGRIQFSTPPFKIYGVVRVLLEP